MILAVGRTIWKMWLFTKNHVCHSACLIPCLPDNVPCGLPPPAPNLVSLVTAVIPGKWGWAMGGVWAEY